MDYAIPLVLAIPNYLCRDIMYYHIKENQLTSGKILL